MFHSKKNAQSQSGLYFGAQHSTPGVKDNYNTKQIVNNFKKKSTASSLGLSQT